MKKKIRPLPVHIKEMDKEIENFLKDNTKVQFDEEHDCYGAEMTKNIVLEIEDHEYIGDLECLYGLGEEEKDAVDDLLNQIQQDIVYWKLGNGIQPWEGRR